MSACFCGCIPADGPHGTALRPPLSRSLDPWPSQRQRSSVECGRPRSAAASLVVNILPMVVFAGGANSRATIASAFLVPSVVASGLRVVPGTGLTFPGEVDVGSSADSRSERRAFCRLAISCAMEVWLDICELKAGNTAVGQKVSRLLGREG